jgi:site-specific recombinase XerD
MVKLEDAINEVNNMVISGCDIKNAMWVVLSRYELVEKNTELSCKNDNIFYLSKFLNTKRMEGLSEKTLEQYKRENERFFLYCNKAIFDITKDDVRAYLAILQTKRKISMTTSVNVKRFLSSFYNWLNDEGIIQKSPTRNLNIKCPKTTRIPFTDRELDVLRNSNLSVRNKAIIELFISTGCRVEEMANIHISDINWYEKSILITGKGNKQRTVFFDDIAAMYLEKYMKDRNSNIDELFISSKNSNKRLEKKSIECVVRKLGRTNKIKAYPHKFRRTFATRALRNGMSITTLSKLMGHEKIETTMLYCQIDNSQIKMSYMQSAR